MRADPLNQGPPGFLTDKGPRSAGCWLDSGTGLPRAHLSGLPGAAGRLSLSHPPDSPGAA